MIFVFISALFWRILGDFVCCLLLFVYMEKSATLLFYNYTSFETLQHPSTPVPKKCKYVEGRMMIDEF